MKSLMKTRKQKETGEKEVHLLEQKGYEKMVNEIVPVQQAEEERACPWNNWKEPASGGTENPDKQRKSGSKLYRTCGWVWMD